MRFVLASTFLLTLGAGVVMTGASATALPGLKGAGLAASSEAIEVRYRRGYRRTPQRVMGLKPGPGRQTGRLLRRSR